MARTHFKKACRIFCIDTAAYLESALIFGKSALRLPKILFVILRRRGIQQNDMTAFKPSGLIKLRIKRTVIFRDEIFVCGVSLIRKTSADYLLHLSVMYVDTWSEPH